MTHPLLVEVAWIGTLMVSGVAFAASSVVAYVTSQMSGEVRKGLLLLSIAAFFGSSALALPAVLHLIHVPVTAAAWKLEALLFLASGVTYALATHYFSETALQLNQLSRGTEEFA